MSRLFCTCILADAVAMVPPLNEFKMKYSFVAAALVGSVFAAGHKAHAGFHERRHYGAAPPAPQGEICEVTTHTVYVTAGPPPVHSTPAGKTSTSKEGPKPTPEHSQPGYPGVPQPSKPAVPEHSQPGYPGVPQPSKPAVPEHSQPGYPGVPQPSKPAVPEESKPSVPEVPESTTCTDEPTGPAHVPEESKPTYPETPRETHPGYPGVPQPSKPAVPEHSQPGYPGVPQPSKPAVPEVPESTTCTDEVPQPTGPAHVPEESKPTYPETPRETHPGYPGVPQPSKPAVPEHSQPGYPGVPQPSKPAVPQESKPSVPESTTCTDEVPQPTGPAHVPEESKPTYPETPQETHPGYPGVPHPSKPAVPEHSQPGYPGVPQPSKPAVPEESKPSVPESTTCTDEVPQPTGPAHVPEESKPTYPETPKETYPGVPQTPEESKPSVPEMTKPSVPETPKETYPGVPQTPEESKPAVPEESKPSYPETPKETYPGVPQTPKESKPAVPEESKPSVPEVTKPSYPETPKETKPAQPSVPASSGEVEKPKPTPSQSMDSYKPKSTGSYSQGDHIVTNGDKWAITYTPYANSGDCKTADEISADIKVISELGFTTIRSYSTDCGVFEHVVPECEKYGLKIIYGIFLEAGGKEGKGCFSDYAENQLKEIKENAPKDSIAMVIVGNECMFNGNCKAEELASYIDHVRKELIGAGFPSDTAVTTTEPVGTWEQMGAALCDHIDVFACQVQPYFTNSITADEAGEFAAQQLEQAAKVCPGAADKGKYITEIGWPSAGRPNGKAVPGKAEQKAAMKSILEKVGSKSCVFSFQDDGWKAEGEYGVEQSFGCSDVLGLDLGINLDLNISL
ncbi:glycoside hydrolase family 17 protein [Stemphylium lycopersici]|uniref:Probable beta-glucosidase btgE n=1 Tax=Stemphylium lycopersici TaxID=183478 RepID=A0A364NCG6_STELY|nr:glycoside hydrolase family 17 protein [Stemphylium lycopersici]